LGFYFLDYSDLRIDYSDFMEDLKREYAKNELIELADATLEESIKEGLDDIENGRVSSHETVMSEIRAKYNY